MRRLDRLLHHLAELAGRDHPPRARHLQGLDHQHLAAGRGPRQARCHADLVVLASGLGREDPMAEVPLELVGRHLVAQRVAGRARARHLAAHGRDLAGETAHAGLQRVVARHRAQRLVGQREIALRQPVVVELARDQVAARDLELLVLAVPRHLDHLDALEQRVRDHVDHVGAQDQHRVRQVARQSQVVVHELGAGLGVEQLEQRLGDPEAALPEQAVHAVDHQHRIAHARLPHRAHQLAGLSPGQRAAHALDLARVACARDADAYEWALQRPRNRCAERGLAGPGRADQAQRRARQIGLEPADGEILDHALLGLREREMVALEHGLDALQICVLVDRALPGHGPQPLEVRADVAGLGRAGRKPAQAVHLALGLPRHLERHAPHGAGGGAFDPLSLATVQCGGRCGLGAQARAGLPST